jgi:hypothetical protein
VKTDCHCELSCIESVAQTSNSGSSLVRTRSNSRGSQRVYSSVYAAIVVTVAPNVEGLKFGICEVWKVVNRSL